VLAPLFFIASALIIALPFMQAFPFRLGWHRGHLSVPRLLLLFTLVAAIGGFIGGTRGFAAFLGHTFYTHTEPQRSAMLTALIWAAIAFLAHGISAIT